MPDIDKAAALTRIAKWMGWTTRRPSPHGQIIADTPDGQRTLVRGMKNGKSTPAMHPFEPFDVLRDAFALQVEIERRGLALDYVGRLLDACKVRYTLDIDEDIDRGLVATAYATADQRTLAVLAVIEQEAANG